MVLTRNTISGQVADLSPKLLQHPKFKDVLEVVDAGAKPYVPELYKPGTKQEKESARIVEDVIVEDDVDAVEDNETEEEN